uniref:C2 domain-containing protein n=1 Tax=Macrostomum lignano TaxID=282301 RepID=A0A1I8F435_9PLAT
MSLTLTETVDAKVTASAVTQTGIAKQQQQKQSLQHQSDSQQQRTLQCRDATITTIITVGRSSRAVSNRAPSNRPAAAATEHSDTAAGEVPAPSTLRQLNAYACLELDEPYQRHVTRSVFGSANPYWDQHYMLRLSMHVFDRSGRLDTLLGSASMRLSELPELGASHHAAAAFLFVCPATKAEWPPIGASSDSLDDSSTRPNGDASLSRTLGDLAASERENRSSAPVRCHSNREVDRDKDTGNGGK